MTFYQANVLHLRQNGGPLPGFVRRADRSCIAGIFVSLTLHALVIFALFTWMTGQGGQARRIAHPAPEVITVLLDASANAPDRSLQAQQPTVTQGDSALATNRPDDSLAVAVHPVAASAASGSTGVPATSPAVGGAGQAGSEPAAPAAFDPALGDDYRRRLQAHIAGFRRRLDAASGGLVQVQLAIGRDGDVLAVAVARSSGDAQLDDEAVATIWRARPMPAIPSALPARLVVTLPVSFDPRQLAAARGTQ